MHINLVFPSPAFVARFLLFRVFPCFPLLSLVSLNTLLTSVTLFALARVDGIHIGLVCVGLFPSISASLSEPVFVTGKGVGLNLRGELS